MHIIHNFRAVGYEYLRQLIPYQTPALTCPAFVAPVTSIQMHDNQLHIPKAVAPNSDDLLEHLVFALRYESIDLAILTISLRQVVKEQLEQSLHFQPTSKFLRILGYLWEQVNKQELTYSTLKQGNYINFFDQQKYYTSTIQQKNKKWRINFNGLGNLNYCPVVRKIPSLQQRNDAVLTKLSDWLNQQQDSSNLNRILTWAYLSETKSSFAIEHETVNQTKAQAFVSALKAMTEQQQISENYLIQLQQMVVSRPFNQEFQFRTKQNWLQRSGRGALSIRYIPPPEEHIQQLMDNFILCLNKLSQSDLPIFHQAAVASFGFVYLHPFMDGNGRVSRLLAQQRLLPALSNSVSPAILPLSVAMVANEAAYLTELERFSIPMRMMWNVLEIENNQFKMQFNGDLAYYIYWDSTQQSRFIIECAEYALTNNLINETLYLQNYDKAYKVINEKFDWPDNLINLIIRWIVDNNYLLSKNRLKDKRLFGISQQDLLTAEKIVCNAFKTD